jgi:hypothetical protein
MYKILNMCVVVPDNATDFCIPKMPSIVGDRTDYKILNMCVVVIV